MRNLLTITLSLGLSRVVYAVVPGGVKHRAVRLDGHEDVLPAGPHDSAVLFVDQVQMRCPDPVGEEALTFQRSASSSSQPWVLPSVTEQDLCCVLLYCKYNIKLRSTQEKYLYFYTVQIKIKTEIFICMKIRGRGNLKVSYYRTTASKKLPSHVGVSLFNKFPLHLKRFSKIQKYLKAYFE